MATSWIPQEEEYQKYKMEADEFIWDVVGNKYGGYLDITTALKLNDALDMPDSLTLQINEFESEFDGNEQIDPVALVIRNAISRTEFELYELGVEISFNQHSNFIDFAVWLDDSDKEKLLDALRLDENAFDELSITATKLFEIANCEIKDLKQEVAEEENAENHKTSIVRRK